MQNFKTLALFFLVEKQGTQKEEEEEREIMASTIVTTSAQRRSDQNLCCKKDTCLNQAKGGTDAKQQVFAQYTACTVELHLLTARQNV